MTSTTEHLTTGARVLYRAGSKPAKGTVVTRTAGLHDVNERVMLDGEDQVIETSRYWLTVLGEGDKVPGLSVADLTRYTSQLGADMVPIEIIWPDGRGGGETRLVIGATWDRMQGEGSNILRLEVGEHYDH